MRTVSGGWRIAMATPLPTSQSAPSGAPVVGWIREIVLNSPDPWALAEFWSRIVGGAPTQWYDGWVTLEPPPHGQRLSFQGTGEVGTQGAMTMHFDILVVDLHAAHDQVIAAGGRYVEERWSARPGPEGRPIPWRVYEDPKGNRFCLVVR